MFFILSDLVKYISIRKIKYLILFGTRTVSANDISARLCMSLTRQIANRVNDWRR